MDFPFARQHPFVSRSPIERGRGMAVIIVQRSSQLIQYEIVWSIVIIGQFGFPFVGVVF